MLPRIVVERILPELDRLTDPNLEHSLFVGPVRSLPAGITEPERSRLVTAYRQSVAATLLPAYRRLSDFF